MIQICTLKSLEFINPCYYITDDLKIINIDTNHEKSIWVSKRRYPTVSLEYGHGNRIERRFILILKYGMIKGTMKEISNSTGINIQTLYDNLYNCREESKHGILVIIEI